METRLLPKHLPLWLLRTPRVSAACRCCRTACVPLLAIACHSHLLPFRHSSADSQLKLPSPPVTGPSSNQITEVSVRNRASGSLRRIDFATRCLFDCLDIPGPRDPGTHA